MNKKLFLGMFAAAGMLFATSCSNDELDAVQSSSDQAQVTFSLGLEGGMATRAISDGTGAKKLVYAVYKLDAQDNPVLQPVVGSNANSQFVDDEAFDNGLTETVSVTLAKGQTYQIAFWAQNPSCSAYTTTDLTNVGISYTNATNNNETRDAFFKTVQFTVEGDKVIDNIFLKRVFAQINVGVYKSDWEAAVKSGIEIEKSSVVIKNAATSINLLTGEVGDETTDVVVSYAAKEIPGEDLKVDLNNDGDFNDKDEMYKWLSMSYILVADRNADSGNGVSGDERSALESLTYTFLPKSGNNITIDNGLNNIPVQRNWRTNILGKILTGDIQFNITIDPGYIGDYNSQEILEEVLKNGGEVTLFSDATLSDSFTIPAGKEVKINLNGNTLNVNSTNTVNGSLEVSNGDVVINVNGSGDLNTAFVANNGSTIDFSDAEVSVANKNAAVIVKGNDVSVNLNKTTMDGYYGVFAYPSAFGHNRYNNLKITLTESKITGTPALYLMYVDATVILDDKSSATKFGVYGGGTNVNVVYSGEKPVVEGDGTANTVTFYTENQFALKEVLENGGTMKLDSDFTIDEAITVVADKDITIDLDDNTLTIESVSKLAGNLTIKNGTINVAIPRENNGMYAAFKPEGNGYVKVENATVTVAQGNSLVAIYEGDRSSMNAVIDIINSDITVNQGGNGILVPFNVNYVEVNLEKSTISGPDGFIVLETITKALITLDAESSIENIMVADGNVKIVCESTNVPVTEGGANFTIYGSEAELEISETFANGGSMTLDEDLTLSNGMEVVSGANAEIVLDDNTLNVANQNTVLGELTISGGDVDINVPRTDNSTKMGFLADNGSEINVKDAEINVAKGNMAFAIFNKGYAYHDIETTINIENSTISGEGRGIVSPFGAKSVNINLTNSSVHEIFLTDVVEAVITVDATSTVSNLVSDGTTKLTVKYPAGNKPVVTGNSNVTFIEL